MLGSKPAKSAELPLIIPPEVGGDILAYISRMVNADAVQKGKSLFRGRENTAVAAPMVSLVDDGRHEGGLATRFADAEGIPTERTSVIENGILRNLLHDAYTAKKGGTRSTGNSSRSGYSGAPHIATTNFMLLPTNAPAATLFEGVAAGLYVTETQGLHAAINPVSGDFSIPSKGIMIRNGELAEPVTELAISGNLFSLLHDIDGIGDDFTWSLAGSYVGTPTFRVKNVKIGSAD
jgi:PmbA protein